MLVISDLLENEEKKQNEVFWCKPEGKKINLGKNEYQLSSLEQS